MKRLFLIIALMFSQPAFAGSAERPDFALPPSPGIIYTDAEAVANAFACAIVAGGMAVAATPAVAAVVAAGLCTVAMDLGYQLPEWDERS